MKFPLRSPYSWVKVGGEVIPPLGFCHFAYQNFGQVRPDYSLGWKKPGKCAEAIGAGQRRSKGTSKRGANVRAVSFSRKQTVESQAYCSQVFQSVTMGLCQSLLRKKTLRPLHAGYVHLAARGKLGLLGRYRCRSESFFWKPLKAVGGRKSQCNYYAMLSPLPS